jgi:hypothetical protein
MIFFCMHFPSPQAVQSSHHGIDMVHLVMDTGTGIPGGYTGKGIAGTDKDSYFCILHYTRTHTRHTRTHNDGFTLQIQREFPNQAITKKSYYYIATNGHWTNTIQTYIHSPPLFFFCVQTNISPPAVLPWPATKSTQL